MSTTFPHESDRSPGVCSMSAHTTLPGPAEPKDTVHSAYLSAQESLTLTLWSVFTPRQVRGFEPGVDTSIVPLGRFRTCQFAEVDALSAQAPNPTEPMLACDLGQTRHLPSWRAANL
nr:unknown hypothetical protein [Streptomyces ambofaciens ATCC 23877]CAJ87928.1 hypothetical protein SAMR0219 [Streptomyces ambofaciens ATCC 23877]CAK51312.1 hypothetical protein DSMR0231 [Streptomyces ambofaciens]